MTAGGDAATNRWLSPAAWVVCESSSDAFQAVVRVPVHSRPAARVTPDSAGLGATRPVLPVEAATLPNRPIPALEDALEPERDRAARINTQRWYEPTPREQIGGAGS